MSLADALLEMRQLFLAGKYRVGPVVLWGKMADASAGGDSGVGYEVLRALDSVAPDSPDNRPRSFSMWADGAEWNNGRWDYSSPRPPADIARVIARAADVAGRGGSIRPAVFR